MLADSAPTAPAIPPTLPARLNELLWGYQRTQMLYAAAELGLAHRLAGGPLPVPELAAMTGTHAPSLYRLLRALAGHGLFAERADGQFESTPLAALLQTGTPGSMRAAVLVEGGDLYRPWGELLHGVRTGETAFEHLYGMTNWAYREQHPELNTRFNAYMGDIARQKAAAVLRHYRFPEEGTVIDVGGGDGTLLAALLRDYRGVRGTLFNLPHVAAAAAATFDAAGVADRGTVVGGDFFAAVPEGGDRYVLAAVLHDWDDVRSAEILRQCHRAMAPEAKLLLVERVLPIDHSAPNALLRDLHMLITNVGGRERTEQEWRTVLTSGGFRLDTLTPTGPVFHVLEATPV